MTETPVTLQRADDDSLRYAESILGRAGLPTDDLRTAPVHVYVARDGTERIGVGALEVHGSDALLRSVAVEPAERGNGHGTAIVDALETEAKRSGVSRLYLLTTTASDFFVALGYDEIDRPNAPDSIRDTTQFTDLCPSSATCLYKSV
ncbi:arsenic resistance N-acetyltransferase ArsN2 [Halosimplex salinum]|uniref:arsenic resistance N-acetyltransferase ArsN2 n=1 Tax=Halosimplex salinum TaxID=1710538 RepID=UPI000F48D083|nr:arsenic resistance N-acetyltransferase ArsN2 [Halosimplex salinum]